MQFECECVNDSVKEMDNYTNSSNHSPRQRRIIHVLEIFYTYNKLSRWASYRYTFLRNIVYIAKTPITDQFKQDWYSANNIV